MSELFRAQGLSHRFRDGTEALKRIRLTIEDGEFIVIAGRNGSGKTLLARHLVGISTATAGSLLFRGADLRSVMKALRSSVGFVFQDTDSQILGQTVAEDVAFGPANMRLSPSEIAARTKEALAEAKLSGAEERRPETLSGGEKRRLAIAGVLAMRPDCVILDEPFANLDLESARDIIRICGELKGKGITLIIVTHELEKILFLADRLVILDGGEICFDAAPSEAAPELFAEHGLACPFEGQFPWTYPRDGMPASVIPLKADLGVREP
ncbi:MAG TPA: ABC transporter ATP-binding protein [Rectinemataceae bacterium]|nr:ABC transporter ATP-binding protein [Rectinemataceae bacterium]